MDPESASTIFVARIVGPYLAIVGLTFAVRRAHVAALADSFRDNRPLMLIAGVIAILFGATILAFHRHWSDFEAVVITLIGWFALLRGAAQLLIGDQLMSAVHGLRQNQLVILIGGAAAALIGLWLTFVGYSYPPGL